MRKPSLLAVVLIILTSFILYANSLLNGFVYDDVPQVIENLWITDFSNIPRIFASSAWSFLGDGAGFHYYRPMMHAIYTLEYHFFTLDPFFWHLVNVTFHAFNSVMVFLVASFVLCERERGEEASFKGAGGVIKGFPVFPFIAALFFSAHPVATEVVAWVAAIPELSYSTFFLLSFYLYIRSTSSPEKEAGISQDGFTLLRSPAYILSFVFFFVSLFCKEPAIMLIPVIFAYDFFQGRRLFSLQAVKRYIPFIVLAVIYLAIRSYALGGLAPKFSEHSYLSAFQNILNVGPLLFRYFFNLVLPMKFSPFYVFYPVYSLLETTVLLSWVFVVFCALFYLYLFKKRGRAFFAATLIIAPLLPVLYIPALSTSVFAVRYLYLPVAGFTILMAIAVRYFYRRFNDLGKGGVAAALVITLLILFAAASFKTITRNRVWRDDLSLWSETVALYPENYHAYLSLARAYTDIGEVDSARESLEKSIKYNSSLNHPKALALAESWYNLGLLFYDSNEIDKAIGSYSEALRVPVKRTLTRDILNNLGNAYAKEDRIDEAIRSYERALAIDPNDAYVRHNLEAVRKWKRR